MNREMLLEKNKISFEPKLLNIRQMVERQFGKNEEPKIDEVSFFTTNNICEFNVDNSKYDDIFAENFNHQKTTTNDRLPETALKYVECIESPLKPTTNSQQKENTFISAITNSEKLTEDSSLKSITNAQQIEQSCSSTHDAQNRVKHVNVEMFTVVLKQRGSP